MNGFMNGLTDYRALAVIGAEVGILLLVFLLLFIMVKVLFGRVHHIPLLKKSESRAKSMRRAANWFLFLTLLSLSVLVVVGNGYLMFQGQDVYEAMRAWIDSIPADFLQRTAIALARIIGLVVVAGLAIRIARRLLHGIKIRAMAYEQIRSNDASIERFFGSLARIMSNGAWMWVLIVSAAMLSLPAVIPAVLMIALKMYLIVTVGLLLVSAVSAIVDSLDALSRRYAKPDNWLGRYERLRMLIPLLRRCLEYIIYVVVATLVLLQLEFISDFAKYGPALVEAIGIIFLARVAVELVHLVVDKAMAVPDQASESERKRHLTILPIIKNLLKYGVYFVAFVLILGVLNLNPWPILAGAGIVGVVIGFGAQPLINDIVSGFFILFENLYLVGDFVETGTARGTVEAVEMRTTRIRNPNGQLHIIRNGQLGEVVNFSKEYINAIVEVGVSYDSNLDQVYQVLRQAGEELKQSSHDVLESTLIDGLQQFNESDLLIRTVTKVKPGCHGIVARLYRKIIKEAFDREGIEIPFARRVVILKNDTATGDMPRAALVEAVGAD